MNVLVACEFSGVVRRAYRAAGHVAYSCDLEPSDDDSDYHIQLDVLEILDQGWDLMIAHPPCTSLTCSGAWYYQHRPEARQKALEFILTLYDAPIPRIAIENPIGVLSTMWRKPDQIIHPWQFGHGERKATCLWLKNLPKLTPTNIVEGREQRILNMSPGPLRRKFRSITYEGIAQAMASQWHD